MGALLHLLDKTMVISEEFRLEESFGRDIQSTDQCCNLMQVWGSKQTPPLVFLSVSVYLLRGAWCI